jgi:competence protein ComEC
MLRMLLLLGLAQSPANDTLYLTHFDVGQGDATLITTPRGRRILIDAGGAGDSIAARIRKVGVDTIDLLVSTHNHIDHIGGIADVFSSFVVRRYLDNNVPCTTQVCGRTMHAASIEPGLVNIDGGIGDTIDGVFVRYLPQVPENTEENNNSIGVVVQFGRFIALYTGDSQADAMQFWLGQEVVPRAHVIKAPHHGSANGYLAEWQAATRPLAVIVSVGAGNSYKHPDPFVMQQWSSGGAKVFRTDYLGTVQINVVRDGNFSVQFFPAARPNVRKRP